jgi:hypothetical protein
VRRGGGVSEHRGLVGGLGLFKGWVVDRGECGCLLGGVVRTGGGGVGAVSEGGVSVGSSGHDV